MSGPLRPGTRLPGAGQALTIVLAAGQGTRMKSRKPKVLHPLAGKPMLEYVLEVAAKVSSNVVVVIGHGAEEIRGAIKQANVNWVVQEKQLGTAHATLQAGPFFEEHRGPVLVLSGDVPLLKEETVRRLLNAHEGSGTRISFLSAQVEDPTGYGRIVRGAGGGVLRIVEENDATPDEKALAEINAGIYCFEGRGLATLLSSIPCNDAKGEYYLTEAVSLVLASGGTVQALETDPVETLGINSRLDLSQAEALIRRRINQEHMRRGVTLLDPSTTYIDVTVEIGQDTVLYPNTYLLGRTRLGEDCTILPGSLIVDSEVGQSVRIGAACVIEEARIADRAMVGPFSHLRPESVLEEEVHVGNFVEVKKSTLGRGTKANHLSYIGDAIVGKGVNIGAGTITCNYDGISKHQTIIEDDVFVGSDTQLVAPVTVGQGSIIGAGTTLTKNVPPQALALSRAPLVVKESWAKRKLQKRETTE